MTTIEKLAGITAQHNEIVKRVVNGSLDADRVRDALQAIIEKRELTHVASVPAWEPRPAWYTFPADQLMILKQMNELHYWGFADDDFPPVPTGLKPPTQHAVLMLDVKFESLQRTLDELWKDIAVPRYNKERDENVEAWNLRLSDTDDWKHGIRWVWFDPTAYQGLSPESAVAQASEDGARLATTEGLMAVLLFPGWVSSWNGGEWPYPNLTGLWLNIDGEWHYVPALDPGDHRTLTLSYSGYFEEFETWASPSVREC